VILDLVLKDQSSTYRRIVPIAISQIRRASGSLGVEAGGRRQLNAAIIRATSRRKYIHQHPAYQRAMWQATSNASPNLSPSNPNNGAPGGSVRYADNRQELRQSWNNADQ